MVTADFKETNLEWIGNIPRDWKLTSFKNVLDFTVGFTPSTSVAAFYDSDDFAWATIADLNQKYVSETKNKLSNLGAASSAKAPVKKGSLLYSFKLSVGKVAFADVDLYTNEAILAIEPKDDRCLSYLYYMLPLILEYNANYNMYGAKIFNQEVIINSKIPYPPLKRQREIAAFLDRKTAQIDTIIEKKQKLLQLLDEKKKSVINEAVTGQKVWNGNAWVAPTEVKDSGVEWIGEIPKNWQVTKLGYHSNITTGKTPKIQSSDFDYFEEGTVDWFTPSDFTGGPLQSSKRQIHKKSIIDKQVEIYSKGAIYLVGIGATLGKVSYCEKEASANQQINIILLNPEICHYKFAFYYLLGMNEYINSCSDKATLPILNQGKTRDLLFLLPPLKIQMEIVNALDNYIAKSDFLLTRINFQLDKLKEYRQSLISEAVTGKIEIGER